MGSEVKPLASGEAVAKIKSIAKGEIAMLCTFPKEAASAMRSRPMGTAGIDDDGTVWFMTQRDGETAREIEENATVQLIYAIPGRSEFLTLEAKATITRDQAKIDELWKGFQNTWFDGKEDPNLVLIRVRPERGYYWDTKHNKVVQWAEIMIGAITGKEMDDSVEGKLKV
jgi:general stress protein 26